MMMMIFTNFKIVLPIFILIISMVISTPLTTTLSVMISIVISITILLWKKYINRDNLPSLEPPSTDVDDDERPILASQKKFDVFISFRGEDTRKTFTTHLHQALKDGGIETFIDDKLEQGQEISQALLDAIDNSKFSIVIFSKNYATSSWCLDELVHILGCMKKKTQIVLPVFYHVDPSDVRKQRRSYADAFANHKKRFKDTIIQKWKDALTTTSNLAGWHPSQFKNEAELVNGILNYIREKLKSTSTTISDNYLSQGLVGIDKSVANLYNLLSTNDNGQILGICGMGGLGKTKLAEVISEKIRDEFDGHCFVKDVRKEYQENGSTYLAKQFFQRLSKEKDLDFEDLGYVKRRLHHKKLLIVLDDVDVLDQFNSLLKDYPKWLNLKSKIIITSRDGQLLRNIIRHEKMIYHLDILNKKEALQLFHLHAFKEEIVEESYVEISKKFVDYSLGLPLAIEILGCHLYSKRREVWEDFLKEVKKYPDEGILRRLQISFDGLQIIEKNIFLDIACFFRGKKEDDVKQVLDACYCSCNAAIEVLVDKCLVKRSKYYLLGDDYNNHDFDRLQMHDLLQEMGHSIVRGLDVDNTLKNYNRLWKNKDIRQVLGNNMGTSKIKGIFGVSGTKTTNMEPSVFNKMSSLKLLILSESVWMRPFKLPHGLHSFPSELRYLEWYAYPLKSLGSKFTLHNLVHLVMPGSQLEKLPDEFQDVENLMEVDLHFSVKLICVPNLSKANLWKLNLRGCKSLVEVSSLRFHNVHDDPRRQSKVIALHNNFMLKELEAYESSFDDCVLNLKDCYNLRTISEMFGDIKFIYLQGTKIEELHPSIGYLKNLLVLDLSDCENLKNLPSSICYSESLELLVMHGCQSIDKFPKLPLNIKRLDLSGTSIRQINSSSFECMPYLKSLDMSCSKLESLPTTICKLKSLEVLALAHCSQLKSFPEILEPMENLKKILLHCTSIDVVPPSIEHLVNLERLDLSECKNLKSLPMSNIYEMCKISTIFIDENPTQQDLVVLLSLDEYISVALQQSECRGFCSNTNLISILKLNSEHQVYSFWKEITCCECLLFNTILIILMCKTQQDEIFKIKPEWGSEVADRGKALYGPRMGFSYPGNKIPDWCTHTSMGASTHVDSLITWSGRRNFLGIVICIVVNFDDGCIFNDNEWSIYCKMYGLIIEDEPYYIDSSLLKIQKYSDYDTHHVFICYLIKRDIHDRFYHPLIASFIFEFAEENEQYGSCESSRIEQCGIRMVYNEDVEELEEDQLMLDAETHNNVEEN